MMLLKKNLLKSEWYIYPAIPPPLLNFVFFSKFDVISEPPRGIQIVERGTLTNLRRAPRGFRYATKTIRGDPY